MKRVVSLLLVVAMIAAAAVVAGCSNGGSGGGGGGASEPIKIGAVLSMSGQNAALGTSEKKALELEQKRINDAGGINGQQIELVFEDDGTDEAKAVAAATKLIEQDGVAAIIGASGTGTTMAIRGDVDRNKIPQVALAAGSVVTDPINPLVFATPWPNRVVVPFVLQALKDKGLTKIAVLTDTGGYGKDGKAIIDKQAPDYGITIVKDETFNPGDADMSAQLTNIKNSDAQAILLWTAGKDAVTVAKNREQLGIALPLYGGSGQGRREFIEGAGTAAEGFTFGTGRSLVASIALEPGSPQYDAVTEFAKLYEETYGEQPDVFAGHAYDAMAILAAALKSAGTDPAKLRDAIEQTKDLPGFGGMFTYSPTDHNGMTEKDLFLYEIADGQWVAAQ